MAHASSQPCLISPAEVVENLTYNELIPAVEQGLGNFSKRNEEGGGGGIYPQKTRMDIEEHNGVVSVMSGFSPVGNVIVTKIINRYVDNPEHNLPLHVGMIILHDARTGESKAVMDAEHITAMRTAAASAVATKYLAKDGWQTLAILGAGSQAVSHLHALKHMTTIREVRVWTRSSEKCQAFAQKFDVKACETAQEAVTGADVIVTCTSSKTPVLESSWLKPGAHINCVGACQPWAQELGVEVMKKAVIYADNTPGAYQNSGDIVHSKVTVFAEIGEVINGTKEAKRDELTVFKSQGLAVEDAVAAKIVYDKVSVLKDMKL
ncbi:ketimine reductase mu-crystallin [Strongylocentrotus purpuratus]|uniref:Ketimine reductase mu-crystallin n=1 Tax=Strongylocentrotus purpuratus TaxID=7668 RepID=A0A7M7P6P5_STRPU|nr:ketimine reductase mu-crystallin [Strongylocentrotus purpuratus]XP_030846076.1 ketimine reductase mu-crystallin [Strongylocentrotus purpuratus]XP_030846077.1 ketimine reductase mu-crystallin [Strongylocentrotus purpuratus]